MNRLELEATLSRDRAWLLDTLAALPPGLLNAPATPSEHDPATMWSLADHFVHLALVENNFNLMVRKFLAGEANPVPIIRAPDGGPKPQDELMRDVHRWTEEWAIAQRGKPLDELVAVTQRARSDTIGLIAELQDAQFGLRIPGAPWGDGTVGGVLAIHGMHGRMHFKWAKEGLVARGHPVP